MATCNLARRRAQIIALRHDHCPGCLIPDFDGAIFSVEWNGALWARFCTGAPWRDLPDHYGPCTTVYNRFNRRAKRGICMKVFENWRNARRNRCS